MRDDRQRRRHRADAQASGQAAGEFVEPLAHGVALGQHAGRMLEHEQALGGEAVEPVPALDDRHAELFLEIADRGRQRRLRDVTGLGGAAEMLLA